MGETEMNMIKETRKIPLNESNELCPIAYIKPIAGEYFDTASIGYEWGYGLVLVWQRPETQAEMDARLARSARTKENTRLNMLEQVAAIEKRIAKDQQKLQNVKKTIADHYSE
jgi:hypothetical protein